MKNYNILCNTSNPHLKKSSIRHSCTDRFIKLCVCMYECVCVNVSSFTIRSCNCPSGVVLMLTQAFKLKSASIYTRKMAATKWLYRASHEKSAKLQVFFYFLFCFERNIFYQRASQSQP